MRKAILIAMAFFWITSLTLAESGPDPTPPEDASAAQELPAASPPHAESPTFVVPAQTEADIQLLSGIHSRVSHVGDPFAAQLVHPVKVDGHVVLPAGSLIGGRITYIRPAGRLRRAAELGLRFERVTLPDGQDQPFTALLLDLDEVPNMNTEVDNEGSLRGTGAGTWKRLAGGLFGLGAFSAVQTQLAGAAALGITLPIGGGAVLGYSFLIPKGNEVHVPPDTQMRIRLSNPLTVRVAW
jgi:hypothetical protein